MGQTPHQSAWGGGPRVTTDEVARRAAQLFETGKARSLPAAIRLATEQLHASDTPKPGHGRVRKHAQAMMLQSLGDVGYAELQRHVWDVAEQLMTTLMHALPDVECDMTGRAAKGQIDCGAVIRVRAYTRRSIEEIAAVLVEYDYEEPKFEAPSTKYGKLSRIRFFEEGEEVTLTRVPPTLRHAARTDLFKGEPVHVVTVDDLRAKLAS